MSKILAGETGLLCEFLLVERRCALERGSRHRGKYNAGTVLLS